MSQTTHHTHAVQVRIFWVLAACICVAGAVYFYAINQTVHNVVERKEVNAKVAELHSDIGTLEFQYISKRNAINLATARKRGFRQVSDATYISRPALGQRTQNDT